MVTTTPPTFVIGFALSQTSIVIEPDAKGNNTPSRQIKSRWPFVNLLEIFTVLTTEQTVQHDRHTIYGGTVNMWTHIRT